MNTLIFSATVEGIKTRKDRTLSISLGTQEFAPEGYANLFSYNQKLIQVLIKEEDITDKEIEELKNNQFDEFDKRADKTPSQRLRNVFYVLWMQDTKGFNEFKDYYDYRMEALIDYVKEQIEES